jgi:hypothetical protein
MSLTLVSVGVTIYNNEKKCTVLFLQLVYFTPKSNFENLRLEKMLPNISSSLHLSYKISLLALAAFVFTCPNGFVAFASARSYIVDAFAFTQP